MSLRLGLVGVDSSHAPAFTRLLNGHPHAPPAVKGARIALAWRGEPSTDFPPSYERIDDFARAVAALGVPFCATPEEVAERCDASLIVAADARTHPGYFARLAPFGKPVYVDTRFALSPAEARRMLERARTSGALPLAGSPKRFAADFRAALRGGAVTGIDVVGPLPMQPTHPGLHWYGVHLVDLVVAALGPGCATVTSYPGLHEIFLLCWGDGRVATIRGTPGWSPHTRGVVSRSDGSASFDIVAGQQMYTGLLSSILRACVTGKPNVAAEEIEETVAIVTAANLSRDCGRPVGLEEVPQA